MIISVNEENFEEEVLRSSQPVVVEFWAPWCGVCRMVGPVLLKFQSEENHHLKLVRVNADKNLKLANSHRLTNLPTLLLFEKGVLVHRIEGFQGREDLQATLRKFFGVLATTSV